MKKLIFTVALIGVLIGSTLGGLALADKGGEPNYGSSPLENIDDILNKLDEIEIKLDAIDIDTGNVTLMETYSGFFQRVNIHDELHLMFTDTRHVSMTICLMGLDVGSDSVKVESINIYGFGPTILHLQQGDNGSYTVEFDADNVHMNIDNGGGNTITLSYYITTTYPRCDLVPD